MWRWDRPRVKHITTITWAKNNTFQNRDKYQEQKLAQPAYIVKVHKEAAVWIRTETI